MPNSVHVNMENPISNTKIHEIYEIKEELDINEESPKKQKNNKKDSPGSFDLKDNPMERSVKRMSDTIQGEMSDKNQEFLPYSTFT